MDMGIKDKAAIVAGASKGLGRAVARGLAAEGAKVAICARNAAALAATAREIEADFGVQVFHQAVDLGSGPACADFVQKAASALGGADILVNNAGGPPFGYFDDFDEETWLKAVKLTLFSAQAMTRQALPLMRAAGWGRVINMTSISVKQPLDGLMLSNSIRAAVTGWAKSLADELAASGITVNNVLPGWILTERVENLLSAKVEASGKSRQEVEAEAVANIPMKRIGKPEEFADLVVFLASARAGYITGANYWIDGGLYRGLL